MATAADEPSSKTKSAWLCEANFDTGELAHQRGDKDEAARLFRLGAARCPQDLIKRDGAMAELKTPGVAP